jgi:hypothetical protein
MENNILESRNDVKGQIYVIENINTKKSYIGQTVTHRKNHKKYRPFGYIGRFKDHLSEALCNTKKKQSRYLNNAIRMYGKDVFKVSLLHTCPLTELDKWEQYYIESYNTLFPNGYNLTKGGKRFESISNDVVDKIIPLTPGKRGGSIYRSKETRTLISERLKESCNKEEFLKERMKLTQNQHKDQKLDRFRGETIDITNLSQYIRFQNRKTGPLVKVIVNKKEATFVGKHQTVEELENRAIEFLKNIATIATLSNCSGNP